LVQLEERQPRPPSAIAAEPDQLSGTTPKSGSRRRCTYQTRAVGQFAQMAGVAPRNPIRSRGPPAQTVEVGSVQPADAQNRETAHIDGLHQRHVCSRRSPPGGNPFSPVKSDPRDTGKAKQANPDALFHARNLIREQREDHQAQAGRPPASACPIEPQARAGEATANRVAERTPLRSSINNERVTANPRRPSRGRSTPTPPTPLDRGTNSCSSRTPATASDRRSTAGLPLGARPATERLTSTGRR
jgi:hypothetical protein